MKCPCCSGQRFKICCGPLLQKKRLATTPLELMRSRYSAFVNNDLEYIQKTMAGQALKTAQLKTTTHDPLENQIWLGLELSLIHI